MRTFGFMAVLFALMATACGSAVVVGSDTAPVEAAADIGLTPIEADPLATPVPAPVNEAVAVVNETDTSVSADDPEVSEPAEDPAAVEPAAEDPAAVEPAAEEPATEDAESALQLDIGEDDAPPALEVEHVAEIFAKGECYGNVDWAQQPTVVPCTSPHLAEVTHIAELALSSEVAFPGDPRMKVIASQECRPYVGNTVDELRVVLDVEGSRAWPDDTQWADGDRSVACVVKFNGTVDFPLDVLRDAAKRQADAQEAEAERNRLLQNGACYTKDGMSRRPYTPVSCTSLHYAEVFHVGLFSDPAGTANPGTEGLGDRARPVCRQVFMQRMGFPIGETSFSWSARVPSPAWDSGDRRFECIVYFDSLVNSPLSALDARTFGDNDSTYDIQRGTCLESSNIGAERSIVPCSQPHNFQVIISKNFAAGGAVYPGSDELRERASSFCQTQAQLSGANKDMPWTLNILWPHPDSWAKGDGTVVCFARTDTMVTTSVFGG